MAPVAIGTETNGSLSAPALRASLYSLKPTLGLIPGEGIIPISHRFDIAGPLAKDTRDVADLLSALVDFRSVPKGGYVSTVGDAESWNEIKVGTLDPEKWKYPDFMVRPVPQATDEIVSLPVLRRANLMSNLQVKKTRAAYALIKTFAKSYHENVSLRPADDFDIDGQNSVSEALSEPFLVLYDSIG
jgi:amidase